MPSPRHGAALIPGDWDAITPAWSRADPWGQGSHYPRMEWELILGDWDAVTEQG